MIFSPQIPNTSSYQTREILPSTGLWNYLPVFGIWARIVHYLAVDSEGLGDQVKTLDKYFKNKYKPEKYVSLVNRIVDKLPKVIIAFRVLKIKDNLRHVRDPKTGRTLGEAFDIIHDIGSDDDAVNEIATKLNLVSPDNISVVGSSPSSDFDLRTTLKNAILENPTLIGDVLKDPQVVNFITSGILQYLASNKIVHGIESMQQLITILEIAHPNMFQEGQNSLSDLRDEKSGKTFIKTLETLVNIIENPRFPEELAKVLNNETLTYLHEKAQDALTKVIENKSKGKMIQRPDNQPDDASPSDTPAAEENDDQNQEQSDDAPPSDTSAVEENDNQNQAAKNEPTKMTAKDFIGILSMVNVKLDEKTAERILQLSEKNELGDKANNLLTKISQIEDLTPQKVAQFLAGKGVSVDQKSVEGAIDMIISFDAEMLASTLQGMGLNIPKDEVKQMKETVQELKKTYDKNHPPVHTNRVPDVNMDEDHTQPPQSIFHQNEPKKDEENSGMI